MKCGSCNGTGTWGKVSIEDDLVDTTCPYCKGTGMIQMTKEEWFCQLSTEEKATFLASNKMLNFDYQMWIEWLKEKHNESV